MSFIKKFLNRKFFKDKAPKAFGNTYSSIHKSNSYLKYCDKVHKRELRLLNTMCSHQLERLEIFFEKYTPKTLLDIGCGNGELTQYLSDKFSTNSTGVDFSIKPTKTKNVEYEKLDHESFSIKRKFDFIISIDSFYMILNYKSFLKNLTEHLNPNGKIIIFLTLVDESFENSKLKKSLSKLKLQYKIEDLTKYDKTFWDISNQVLEEMNQDFVDENHFPLWNIKHKEVSKNLNLHSDKRIQRVLLEISKD
jgi:SAM-dependent methyltransferase